MAISVLAAVGPDDARSKETVLRALNDNNSFVRRNALQALIRIHDLSAEDLERIKSMENDPDSSVASWSEIALRNIRINRKTKT